MPLRLRLPRCLQTLPHATEYLTASGLRVSCVTPMQKWRLSYDGNLVATSNLRHNLKRAGAEKPASESVPSVRASFELTWTAQGKSEAHEAHTTMLHSRRAVF